MEGGLEGPQGEELVCGSLPGARAEAEGSYVNVGVTIYGVCAVSFMMAMYALEKRGRGFILAFAGRLPSLQRLWLPIGGVSYRGRGLSGWSNSSGLGSLYGAIWELASAASKTGLVVLEVAGQKSTP